MLDDTTEVIGATSFSKYPKIAQGHLEFLDMQKLFGVDVVQGALWVNDWKVGIDRRFEPFEIPFKIGRNHFTLAREPGRWRLHRHLFLRNAKQSTFRPDSALRPEYICRSSDNDPIEFKADRIASYLMMAKELLRLPGTIGVGTWTPCTSQPCERRQTAMLPLRFFSTKRSDPLPRSSRFQRKQ